MQDDYFYESNTSCARWILEKNNLGGLNSGMQILFCSVDDCLMAKYFEHRINFVLQSCLNMSQ